MLSVINNWRVRGSLIMSFKVSLKVQDGPLAGKKFTITENMTCIIGRENDCGIRIPEDSDMSVSRHHCRLKINFPEVTARDMRSENGSALNGKKLEAEGEIMDWPIKDGDLLTIGQTVFKVSLEGESDPI